jgi:hypothetical protein
MLLKDAATHCWRCTVDAITAADLANAVAAYAVIFAGLCARLLSALMGRQARRWLLNEALLGHAEWTY